jgi:hypothetical protein
MRSEQEIRNILAECKKVCDFGMSKGPCPLKADEKKDCINDCSWDLSAKEIPSEDLEREKKNCCELWDMRRGCCAECSFPSALEWVLGEDRNGADNGQERLMDELRGWDELSDEACLNDEQVKSKENHI